MRMGISTACLYPMEVEVSLDALLAAGFRLFEIFFNTYSEIRPGFIARLNERIQAHGAIVKSIHPFTSGFEGYLFFTEYGRRCQDALEFYKYYFEAAQGLGAEILVLHGQKDYQRSNAIPEELYFERYAALYALGKSYGITVAQENVNQFRSESPAFIRRMRAALGEDCAFVLDVKQAVRAGYSPYEMCSAMGKSLVHVHLNDNRPGEDCLLPGQGEMDFARLKSMLLSFGYQGDWMIEVYRGSFGGLEELAPAGRKVRDIILKNA